MQYVHPPSPGFLIHPSLLPLCGAVCSDSFLGFLANYSEGESGALLWQSMVRRFHALALLLKSWFHVPGRAAFWLLIAQQVPFEQLFSCVVSCTCQWKKLRHAMFCAIAIAKATKPAWGKPSFESSRENKCKFTESICVNIQKTDSLLGYYQPNN